MNCTEKNVAERMAVAMKKGEFFPPKKRVGGEGGDKAQVNVRKNRPLMAPGKEGRESGVGKGADRRP